MKIADAGHIPDFFRIKGLIERLDVTTSNLVRLPSVNPAEQVLDELQKSLVGELKAVVVRFLDDLDELTAAADVLTTPIATAVDSDGSPPPVTAMVPGLPDLPLSEDPATMRALAAAFFGRQEESAENPENGQPTPDDDGKPNFFAVLKETIKSCLRPAAREIPLSGATKAGQETATTDIQVKKGTVGIVGPGNGSTAAADGVAPSRPLLQGISLGEPPGAGTALHRSPAIAVNVPMPTIPSEPDRAAIGSVITPGPQPSLPFVSTPKANVSVPSGAVPTIPTTPNGEAQSPVISTENSVATPPDQWADQSPPDVSTSMQERLHRSLVTPNAAESVDKTNPLAQNVGGPRKGGTIDAVPRDETVKVTEQGTSGREGTNAFKLPFIPAESNSGDAASRSHVEIFRQDGEMAGPALDEVPLKLTADVVPGYRENPADRLPSVDPQKQVAPATEDRIAARIIRFVQDVNSVVQESLDAPAETAEKTAQTFATDRSPSVTEALRSGADKAVPQNVLRAIFLPDQGMTEVGEKIGISFKTNGALHLDPPSLTSALTLNREEALVAVKELSRCLSERIDCAVNPWVGIYTYEKKPAFGKDIRSRKRRTSPEQVLAEEQNGLEKRFKELSLLIDRSTVFRDWFVGRERLSKTLIEVAHIVTIEQEEFINLTEEALAEEDQDHFVVLLTGRNILMGNLINEDPDVFIEDVGEYTHREIRLVERLKDERRKVLETIDKLSKSRQMAHSYSTKYPIPFFPRFFGSDE
jgi:hypothetical protein